jgi:hypothetical protein
MREACGGEQLEEWWNANRTWNLVSELENLSGCEAICNWFSVEISVGDGVQLQASRFAAALNGSLRRICRAGRSW